MEWNRNLTPHEVALEKRIAELENLLAEGVHTCSHLCKRPMCVLRREKRELEAKVERLEKTIRDALLCDTVVQMSECLQVALDKEKE